MMQMAQPNTEDQLWQAYRAELVGFVQKRVADQGLAEDLVHDVLVKVFDRRDTLKNAEKLRSWLYQITRNTIVDHFRSKRPSAPLPEDLVAEEAEEGGSAAQELARCMRPLVDQLPTVYREAVVLAEFAGLDQAEVAVRQGLSLSGAKSRIQRGRKLLAEALLDCCRIVLDQRRGVADYACKERCGGC